MERPYDGIGSSGIAHERVYWEKLAESYDTFEQYGRYPTGER